MSALGQRKMSYMPFRLGNDWFAVSVDKVSRVGGSTLQKSDYIKDLASLLGLKPLSLNPPIFTLCIENTKTMYVIPVDDLGPILTFAESKIEKPSKFMDALGQVIHKGHLYHIVDPKHIIETKTKSESANQTQVLSLDLLS